MSTNANCATGTTAIRYFIGGINARTDELYQRRAKYLR